MHGQAVGIQKSLFRAAKLSLRYLEFVLVALAFDILADFNDLFS